MSFLLALCVAQDEGAFWSALLETIKPLWIGKNDPAPFVPPPAEELEALEAYAAGPLDAPLPPALERAGWRVEWRTFGSEKLRLLREAPEAKRGRGWMLSRPAGGKLALMAPHRFFDKFTGDVARGVFFRANASFLLENTAHRHWRRAEGEEYGPSDAAHRTSTALHALAKGALAGRPGLLLAQVHGFNEDDAPLAIVSDGTRDPAGWARSFAEALRTSKIPVELHGVDGRRLGGTENVLRPHARRFLHLELSLPLRESLKADASRLADALRASAE